MISIEWYDGKASLDTLSQKQPTDSACGGGAVPAGACAAFNIIRITVVPNYPPPLS